MGLIDVGAVLVALIAALGAWAAQRSATKASKFNTSVSSRLDAERDAYERARTFDLVTIDRQDSELSALREENQRLQKELREVKMRVAKLEKITPDYERLLREYFENEDDD